MNKNKGRLALEYVNSVRFDKQQGLVNRDEILKRKERDLHEERKIPRGYKVHTYYNKLLMASFVKYPEVRFDNMAVIFRGFHQLTRTNIKTELKQVDQRRRDTNPLHTTKYRKSRSFKWIALKFVS